MSEDNRRRCWYCEVGILIWGADHDAENDEHLIVTNLSCSSCGASDARECSQKVHPIACAARGALVA